MLWILIPVIFKHTYYSFAQEHQGFDFGGIVKPGGQKSCKRNPFLPPTIGIKSAR